MFNRVDRMLALILPISVAGVLSGFAKPPAEQQMLLVDERLNLIELRVNSAEQLRREFERYKFSWPLEAGQSVPPLEVNKLPGDLAQVTDVKQKKALFFRALLPIVLAENAVMMDLRNKVIELLDKGTDNLSSSEVRWLETVAGHHKVRGEVGSESFRRKLLSKVDIIPPELALAQAANESAWGTSRFSRLGNNLFGQWTYKQSEGIVPLERPEGATYAVRAFSSVDASVRAYIYNLNTNAAYKKLRAVRQQQRDAGQEPGGFEMATGLHAYSARGDAYIEELRAMMRTNALISTLSGVRLAESG